MSLSPDIQLNVTRGKKSEMVTREERSVRRDENQHSLFRCGNSAEFVNVNCLNFNGCKRARFAVAKIS